MRFVYLMILLFLFSTSSAFSKLGAYNVTSMYYSDLVNIFQDAYVSSFVVHSDNLYALLDTGNTGVAKLFKTKTEVELIDTNDYKDNYIEWEHFFGDTNNFILRKNNLVFLTNEGIVRIVLLQKSNNIVNPRIVDISPQGTLISDKTLDIPLSEDAKLIKLADNQLAVAYSQQLNGSNKIIILKFNIDGKIIIQNEISDSINTINLKEFVLAENGEFSIVSAYLTEDCYWRFSLFMFDNNLSELYNYPAHFQSPYANITLGRSFDRKWLLRYVYFRTYDSVYSTKIFEISQNSAEEYPISSSLYVSFPVTEKFYEPFKGGFLSFGTSYNFMNKLCDVNFDKSVIFNSLSNRQGFSWLRENFSETGEKNMVCYVYQESDSVYYMSGIYGNAKIFIDKVWINTVVTSINEDNDYQSESISYYVFSGSTATIKTGHHQIQDYHFVEIYDLLGNLITSDRLLISNEFCLPIENIQNGVYFYYIPELNIRGKFGVMR